MEKRKATTITVLGSGGGVARAILTILNRAAKDRRDPIRALIRDATFYLIDHKQKDLQYYQTHFPNLQGHMQLLEFDLADLARL